MDDRTAPLDPDRQLGYLLARAADAVSRSWHQALRDSGINPRQFSVLALVADDETLSQGELARRVLITPQSMSELLRSLESAGLIERGDAGRGRPSNLVVTSAGHELLRQAYPVVRNVDREAFAALTDAERATLDGLLRKLAG